MTSSSIQQLDEDLEYPEKCTVNNHDKLTLPHRKFITHYVCYRTDGVIYLREISRDKPNKPMSALTRVQPMSCAKKIVLNCPAGYKTDLGRIVEDFIRNRVLFVGVVGKDCVRIEDTIDELVVGDASLDYDLLTFSHPNDSLASAVEFAKSLTGKFKGDIQVVEL